MLRTHERTAGGDRPAGRALASVLAAASIGVAGCGDQAPPSSTSSGGGGGSASAVLDRLALTAQDLGGDYTFQSSGPVPLQGLSAGDSRATVFLDRAGTSSVTDVIIVFADAAAAHQAYLGGLQDAQREVAAPAVSVLPFGPEAKVVRGQKGNRALALVRLREASVYAEIDFATPTDQPVATELVTRLTALQDQRIVAAS